MNKKFKVTMKEVGREGIIEQIAIVPTREDCIKIYGLKEPDIEWYKIEEIR